MPEHRVVVVGAGMAGLVSALQLAHQGLDVTVLESADSPGGKIRQPIVDGAAIDGALMEDTAQRIADIRASAEGREGIQSFLERRDPWWRGEAALTRTSPRASPRPAKKTRTTRKTKA